MNAEILWIVAGAALVLILAADVWLAKRKRPTMSKRFWQAIATRPFIPLLLGFGVGYLLGHLTWPSESCFAAILQGLIVASPSPLPSP